ncbi:MAG: DUF937 domain-containing protein [Hyphomicrobiaceae bacterium]
MDLFDIVRQAQGGNAIANMARAFNLSPTQAEAAVKAVIPELARGIERNTLSRGGIADLIEAMGNGRAAQTMENPSMFGHPSVQKDGNAILGHILGPDKDTSRAAAQRASLSSGLGEGLIKMLLPYIAQLLMGALTKGTQGGLGDILSKIPGLPGNPSPSPSGRGGGMSFPQSRTSGNAPLPFPMPDNNPFGGGAPSTCGGGFEGQQPLPLPSGLPPEGGSGNNPYGDLSDIIRRGGSAGSVAGGGGMLWNIIRSMLGGALGFSTKGGVMGWIFRAVILRYGWSILRAIFGGLIGRR